MKLTLYPEQLLSFGISEASVSQFFAELNKSIEARKSPAQAWELISKAACKARFPFPLHLFLYSALFPNWLLAPEEAPAWIPQAEEIASANLTAFMSLVNIADLSAFHTYTIQQPESFWQHLVKQLSVQFKQPFERVMDLTNGLASPRWFHGAKMNISDSCFNASHRAPAIIFKNEEGKIAAFSYGELERLSNRIANSLIKQGFSQGDAIGIAMPMNIYAIAIYLGIIKMGGIVVSIADSFSLAEMATRLRLTEARGLFTQDINIWNGKQIALYEKIKNIRTHINQTIPFTLIIVPYSDTLSSSSLSADDITWDKFLVAKSEFISVPCEPMAACNILFSSGTTGDPKAIVWNHTTAIKAASDAFFHQNIKKGDVLSWPTNLGWMMGPWLIYAAFLNQASIAIYPESPKDRAFGEFIAKAKVTMLGVVPTLVATWRQSRCMENLDWRAIKIFSSTGECSNPEDMFYLMYLADYKPIIEYCGGTEIGGGYISSTIIENNYPALFSTPTMGSSFTIIDENGKIADSGEVALIPPALGLSTVLLNANHHQIYYENMPRLPDGRILRRHGDQIKRLPEGHYSILGRVDDTMNLGGIKISAAEIERTLAGIEGIGEVAAIAISPNGQGPSVLVIYAAQRTVRDKHQVMQEMQQKINAHLNPLFKIYDVVFIDELPKTASNKIMRRKLRDQHVEKKLN